MKKIFIVCAILFAIHGIYLLFGGTFLRSNIAYVHDVFCFLMCILGIFAIENKATLALSRAQMDYKKKLGKNILSAQFMCVIVYVMTIVFMTRK